MTRVAGLALTVGLWMTACDSGTIPEPVVIYASAEQESRLAEMLSRFTDETRVPVKVVVGDSSALTDTVINNRGTPTADVLLTSSIADTWRAADRGALRPLTGTAVGDLPPLLKDPDRLWAALEVRYAIIGVSPGAEHAGLGNYADLAESDYRGAVCLSSAALPVNRSLVAMLAEDLGVKPAERIVRAWVRNLGSEPFATEGELLDAMRSGACGYGIFSSTFDTEGLAIIRPNPLYLDIDGIGVARHAHSPESAQALVNWLLRETPLRAPEFSNGKNVGVAGWRDEDARLLAERAGYR